MSTYDDDDRTAQLLSDALHDEAARVEPGPGGLQAIQRRTATTHLRSRSRSRWTLAVGAGLATAAVATTVVVLSQSGTGSSPTAGGKHSTPPSAGGQHGGSTNPDPAVANHRGVYDPSAPAAAQVTMYYVGPPRADSTLAPFLYAERHTIKPSGQAPDVAAAHEFLTSSPLDPDYRSGWPEGVDIQGISASNGVTTIALRGSANLGTKPARVPFDPSRAVAVQGLLETAAVHGEARFTYNGHPLKLVLYTSASIGARPRASLRPPVSIDSLVNGERVSSPVTVKVSGNVFEGNVNWQLLSQAGSQLASGYATTSQGTWTSASVRLGALMAGTYTFRAFEPGAASGRREFVDDKVFTVR
jgi:immunoglobulin-like protein involved in spore germination